MSRSGPAEHLLSHGKSTEEWASAHEIIKTDEALWSSLATDGIQSDGLGGLIEHRRCPACGSSISRHTNALQAVLTLSLQAAVHARSLEAIVSAGAAAQGLPDKK